MKRLATSLATALAVVLLLPACDSSSEDEPPAIIPPEAFSLETDLFSDSNPKAAAGPNFVAAALRVWPISFLIKANLIIPEIVTLAALSDEPEFDDAWIWTSTTTANGVTVEFTLTGTPVDTGIDWSMKVSYSDGTIQLDDFELYRAHSALDGKSGTWELFGLDTTTQTVLLQATFEVDGSNKELTFSVPQSSPWDSVGDSVTYTSDGDDRSFMWIDASTGNEHFVQWSSSTKAGSITADDYNNGAQSCWDASLEDVAC